VQNSSEKETTELTFKYPFQEFVRNRLQNRLLWAAKEDLPLESIFLRFSPDWDVHF
jgi:hypothetical protein